LVVAVLRTLSFRWAVAIFAAEGSLSCVYWPKYRRGGGRDFCVRGRGAASGVQRTRQGQASWGERSRRAMAHGVLLFCDERETEMSGEVPNWGQPTSFSLCGWGRSSVCSSPYSHVPQFRARRVTTHQRGVSVSDLGSRRGHLFPHWGQESQERNGAGENPPL